MIQTLYKDILFEPQSKNLSSGWLILNHAKAEGLKKGLTLYNFNQVGKRKENIIFRFDKTLV